MASHIPLLLEHSALRPQLCLMFPVAFLLKIEQEIMAHRISLRHAKSLALSERRNENDST